MSTPPPWGMYTSLSSRQWSPGLPFFCQHTHGINTLLKKALMLRKLEWKEVILLKNSPLKRIDHSRNTITYHNTLCLSPQNLHKYCLQFLLGVKMSPRETENNAYAKFWDDKQRVLWYVMVFSGVVN